MGYKRIAILLFTLVLMLGAAVVSASAQRGFHRGFRPVVVRPFWGWGYNSFYSDPYYYDPAYREYRDRYYLQKDASDARKKVAKDREKYSKDGYIDPKEQEKLMDDQRKYDEAVARLNKFNRNY